jgi:hypothetical protein
MIGGVLIRAASSRSLYGPRGLRAGALIAVLGGLRVERRPIVGTEELTLEEIGIEFELIAGSIEPRAAVEVLGDLFRGLRAEYEALTAKIDNA